MEDQHLKTLEEVERDYIIAVYNRIGDKILTAKALGISLKTLYNKLNKYEREEKQVDNQN